LKDFKFRVPLEESQDVFRKKAGYRKIILSTNMAESSVTIPDVEVVIDFCLTKNLKSDPASNYIKLKLDWADGNSVTQV
jgi:HrpA-like RNA helicase